MSETWPDAQPASGTTGWRIRCACAAALCLLGPLPDALERQWLRLEQAAQPGVPDSDAMILSYRQTSNRAWRWNAFSVGSRCGGFP